MIPAPGLGAVLCGVVWCGVVWCGTGHEELTSQQHTTVSQGRTCPDNCTCCHTETEVAGQIFYFTQSPYTDAGSTSPNIDPLTPGAWKGSHWSANFLGLHQEKIPSQAGFEPRIGEGGGGDSSLGSVLARCPA